MGQALLGIGAGAAGAFGGAYDAARQNRIRGDLGDLELQNVQRQAAGIASLDQAMPALASAFQGIGSPGGAPGMPPGMPPGGPPGMPPQPSMPGGMAQPRPSSVWPPSGQSTPPQGMPLPGQPQPPQGMRPPGMPPQGGPPSQGPQMPPMMQQGGMRAMAPGGMPQPTQPMPGLPPRPPGPPPQGMPQQGQQPPQMGANVQWQKAAQIIAQANPGIKSGVLVEAVDQFMRRFGTPQNQMEWKEQQLQVKQQQQEQTYQKFLLGMLSKEDMQRLKLEAEAVWKAEDRASREGIAGANREAAGERQTERLGAAERLEDKREGFKTGERLGTQDFKAGQARANEAFKLEVQKRNLDAAASRQEKALASKATSGSKMDDKEVETLATAISEYRLAPYSSARASGDAMKVMARVQQLNPAYDAGVWGGKNKAQAQFAAGPEGRTIRSLNVADLHLDTLRTLQKNLNNQTMFNKTINEWKRTFGYSGPVAFDVAKQVVASEVIKAVSGMSGGGQKERLEAAQNISNHLNDKQFDAAVAGLEELLAGQKKGLRGQYEAATGLKDFDKFLFGKKVESGGGFDPGWSEK